MSCNCQQNTCCQGQYGNFDNNGYANYFNSNIGNGFTPQPIIAPKKVCTTFQNQYVEQPIICPIECRCVNNIVYVPRYYPRYEQTCYTQTNRY